MKATVFWPAASFAVVLGVAVAFLGALAAADPEGRGGPILATGLAAGGLLVGAAVVAMGGRLMRAAWRRWRP